MSDALRKELHHARRRCDDARTVHADDVTLLEQIVVGVHYPVPVDGVAELSVNGVVRRRHVVRMIGEHLVVAHHFSGKQLN